jgi:tRNA G18 (ribose-2'-O)-methylase SpoU
VAFVLSDLSEAHYAYFASLKGTAGHLKDGIFIAEGPKLTESMLRSSASVPFALMTESFFAHFRSLLDERSGPATQVHIADKAAMERIVGYPLHQGVMLAVNIPEQPELSAITSGNGPKTIVVLEGINDAENMGTLIRTAAGFGVDAVVVDKTSCHPFLRRAVRVSMGAVITVPMIRSEDLHQTIRELKASSFKIVAAALTDNSQRLSEMEWEDKSVIMLGAEGVGLTLQTLELADVSAMIPMAPNIDSFNVGVACGIFLHERYAKLTVRA